ncbi:hypothetical protein FACS1894125_5320 [Actinomycetota bacterium]|nr:hypothetical protein FACS1894125_5320 [Actinomycetota bacterium]
MNKNLYWSVYKNLEKEVIQLSESVQFDDEQLEVYSIKIAELILRCSTELESLAKYIYRRENGEEPKNPGACFEWMETNWSIAKKQVTIISDRFNFVKKFQPAFTPLGYENNRPEDYYSAYNAIKHDRAKNIKKANVNILIRVLAATYLLNLYFEDDNFVIPNTNFNGEQIPVVLGRKSEVFNVSVFHLDENTLLNPSTIIPTADPAIEFLLNYSLNVNKITENLQSCMYIVKETDEFKKLNEICTSKSPTDTLSEDEINGFLKLFPSAQNRLNSELTISLLLASYPERLKIMTNKEDVNGNT